MRDYRIWWRKKKRNWVWQYLVAPICGNEFVFYVSNYQSDIDEIREQLWAIREGLV